MSRVGLACLSVCRAFVDVASLSTLKTCFCFFRGWWGKRHLGGGAVGLLSPVSTWCLFLPPSPTECNFYLLCGLSRTDIPPPPGHLHRACAPTPCNRRWPRLLQLTADLFAGVCGKSEPRQVYLAATVGGLSGDGGSSFRRALQDLGVPVLACSTYRLHSAVVCSLGGGVFDGEGGDGGAGSSSDHSEGTCVNVKMRDVVRRAVSMVEIFEHWRPAGGAYAAAAAAAAAAATVDRDTLETVGAEVEELAVTLARTRGRNTRRVPWAWPVSLYIYIYLIVSFLWFGVSLCM